MLLIYEILWKMIEVIGWYMGGENMGRVLGIEKEERDEENIIGENVLW